MLTKITKPFWVYLVPFVVLMFTSTGTTAQTPTQQPKVKMKVEIWSDVMCPFCYIGKRKFEAALAQFENKDNIEVVWKSFQLQPNLVTDTSKNSTQYLAQIKGWSIEQAREANNYVTNMAAQVELKYNLEQTVVANSFDAHRLIQYAKTKGKGDAMEEQLFKAYFTDGKNTANHTTLTELAVMIGLNKEEVQQVLSSNAFSNEVRQDIYESQQIGVTGVPFFVFNNKYAVSGAQASETFLGALRQAYSEIPTQEKIDGAVCTPDGDCD